MHTFDPNTFAANSGAMQHSAIGFPAPLNSFSTRSTSGSTHISVPLSAKSLRFFAAPKPPGKTIASTSESALRLLSRSTGPLAILELSVNTFR